MVCQIYFNISPEVIVEVNIVGDLLDGILVRDLRGRNCQNSIYFAVNSDFQPGLGKLPQLQLNTACIFIIKGWTLFRLCIARLLYWSFVKILCWASIMKERS